MYKATGFRDWQEANDTIRLLRRIINDTDTEDDQRVQAQDILKEMLKDNEDDCIRCGAHFLEMEIHHTLALRERGRVLTFCPPCMDHICKGIHSMNIHVVEETPCKRCTHCDREMVLDDYVPLDKPNEYLCLRCDDKLKGELDDFTNNH